MGLEGVLLCWEEDPFLDSALAGQRMKLDWGTGLAARGAVGHSFQPVLSTSRSLASRIGLVRVITERKPLNSASRRASLA